MTGWRLGYGAGPLKALIAAMAVVQSQATSCPSSISQAAAVASADGAARRGARALPSVPGAARSGRGRAQRSQPALPRVPEGRVLHLASCEGVLGRTTPGGMLLRTDADFCAYLLREHHVAVVPWAGAGAGTATSAFRTLPLPPICRRPAHASSAPARPLF